jgi:hypothetical protein
MHRRREGGAMLIESYQDRVTCSRWLAKVGGGCLGIRRSSALQDV